MNVRFLFKPTKCFVKYLALLGAVLLAVSIFLVLKYGKDIANPARREIIPKYAAILESPKDFGLSIRPLSCLEGKAPTLVVTPVAHGIITDKARIVREQLTGNGVSLQPYGNILGTVVILHGRTLRKENMLSIAQRFCAAGMRCVIIDLPSHGDSPVACVKFGSTEWEQNLPRNCYLI